MYEPNSTLGAIDTQHGAPFASGKYGWNPYTATDRLAYDNNAMWDALRRSTNVLDIVYFLKDSYRYTAADAGLLAGNTMYLAPKVEQAVAEVKDVANAGITEAITSATSLTPAKVITMVTPPSSPTPSSPITPLPVTPPSAVSYTPAGLVNSGAAISEQYRWPLIGAAAALFALLVYKMRSR